MVWRRGRVALVAFCVIGLNQSCSDSPPGSLSLQDLELISTDNGGTAAAAVGQVIVISLHTIGMGRYGDPSISSSAVAFFDMSFPPEQNPGGPTQIFRFKAVQAGTATIAIEHTEERPPFSVTVDVE